MSEELDPVSMAMLTSTGQPKKSGHVRIRVSDGEEEDVKETQVRPPRPRVVKPRVSPLAHVRVPEDSDGFNSFLRAREILEEELDTTRAMARHEALQEILNRGDTEKDQNAVARELDNGDTRALESFLAVRDSDKGVIDLCADESDENGDGTVIDDRDPGTEDDGELRFVPDEEEWSNGTETDVPDGEGVDHDDDIRDDDGFHAYSDQEKMIAAKNRVHGYLKALGLSTKRMAIVGGLYSRENMEKWHGDSPWATFQDGGKRLESLRNGRDGLESSWSSKVSFDNTDLRVLSIGQEDICTRFQQAYKVDRVTGDFSRYFDIHAKVTMGGKKFERVLCEKFERLGVMINGHFRNRPYDNPIRATTIPSAQSNRPVVTYYETAKTSSRPAEMNKTKYLEQAMDVFMDPDDVRLAESLCNPLRVSRRCSPAMRCCAVVEAGGSRILNKCCDRMIVQHLVRPACCDFASVWAPLFRNIQIWLCNLGFQQEDCLVVQSSTEFLAVVAEGEGATADVYELISRVWEYQHIHGDFHKIELNERPIWAEIFYKFQHYAPLMSLILDFLSDGEVKMLSSSLPRVSSCEDRNCVFGNVYKTVFSCVVTEPISAIRVTSVSHFLADVDVSPSHGLLLEFGTHEALSGKPRKILFPPTTSPLLPVQRRAYSGEKNALFFCHNDKWKAPPRIRFSNPRLRAGVLSSVLTDLLHRMFLDVVFVTKIHAIVLRDMRAAILKIEATKKDQLELWAPRALFVKAWSHSRVSTDTLIRQEVLHTLDHQAYYLAWRQVFSMSDKPGRHKLAMRVVMKYQNQLLPHHTDRVRKSLLVKIIEENCISTGWPNFPHRYCPPKERRFGLAAIQFALGNKIPLPHEVFHCCSWGKNRAQWEKFTKWAQKEEEIRIEMHRKYVDRRGKKDELVESPATLAQDQDMVDLEPQYYHYKGLGDVVPDIDGTIRFVSKGGDGTIVTTSIFEGEMRKLLRERDHFRESTDQGTQPQWIGAPSVEDNTDATLDWTSRLAAHVYLNTGANAAENFP